MTTRLTTRFADAAFCPNCQGKIDAATGLEHGTRPKPGDLSVCAYCSTLLVYDEPPRLHRATDAELATLRPDERSELFAALEVSRAFQKRHPPG